MGLMDVWRGLVGGKPPIRDAATLAAFIDESAAFLVQKGIYDYARARSGHFAKVMLADPGFQAALNRARWRAFPLGLAMVGEMVDAELAVQAGGDRRLMLDQVAGIVLSVFDRYPRADGLSEEEWRNGRADLALHLERLSMHPPKRIIDIPVPFAERYFEMMPFDKPFLTPDAPTARGFLQLTLVRMQEELARRVVPSEMLRMCERAD
jgi:hypothetical protein